MPLLKYEVEKIIEFVEAKIAFKADPADINKMLRVSEAEIALWGAAFQMTATKDLDHENRTVNT